MVDRMDVVVHPAEQGIFVDESGRTREAEARYNLSQDGEAVWFHVQDAGQRAPHALASRRECQEAKLSWAGTGRCARRRGMRHDRQPGQRDGEAQFHPVPLIRGAPRQRHSGR
jgi:hypothetical protein